MSEALAIIDDVITGRFVAPESGAPLGSTVERIVIEPSLAGREAELVRELGLGARVAIVADENTVEISGRRVAKALPEAQTVLLERPGADDATAEHLAERTRSADALIAIGSGTLTDLCKYVSHRTERPCCVFATAPSMNGYVTNTASITRNGIRSELPARAPKAVFFDLGLLAEAPERMILAGLGDCVCRSTAQLDWLFSHLLLGTDYAETPYALLREDEPQLLAAAEGLIEGEQKAILHLVRMLVLSGLGTLVTGTSHCHAMSEHAISHYIDALAKPHPGTLHGEQVGVATWTMARLQSQILASSKPPPLRPIELDEVGLRRRYGSLAPAAQAALARKPFDAAATRKANAKLEKSWPAMRKRLQSVMLPMEALEQVIEDTDLPRTAIQLDIDTEVYRQAVGHAFELDDRYGFLDFAAQAGLLETFARGEV
jgi:glycerol-1-phosphate dehydrogenase [NAD(P)+]